MKPEMKVVATNMRFPDFFPVLESDLSVTNTITFSQNDEYILRAVIGTKFVANKAQLERATDHATRQVMSALYSGAIMKLMDAKSLIYKGDRDASLSMIDSIIAQMRGESDGH